MDLSPAHIPTGAARIAALLLALPGLLLSACGAGEGPVEITATRTVEKGEALPPGGYTSADRFGFHARRAPFSFTAPRGWTRGAERSMRIVTYHPGGDKRAECYVTILRGAAGGVEANLNRWRGQMGQAALSREEIGKLPKIRILGRLSPMLELKGSFRGMSGPREEGWMLYGAVIPLGDRTLFVKMTGPADLLLREKESFIRFCESFR